ncbi:amino acid adenylation domain-containing protein [Gordonia neofelifaecis NRRL B-59395]|uniref:Amino acid adenylation domain-containing protein n=2 Tax=Gordonia TaxID=2053 RepID=F1YPI0_9ACTN|nr:amino acid adenylation domain-containing protein [Gordonia neofelifaecis NRRL B-59395]
MWFAETLSVDYSVNIAQFIDIRHDAGALDVDLFVECCEHVGKQVESPYVRLTVADGIPLQYVDVEYDQHVDVLDFRGEADPEEVALAWMRDEYRRPVDVMTDQLIVVAILRIADDRTFWYSRAHHLILDGYAALTVAKRALDRYNALRRGEEYTDPPAATLAELVDFENDYQTGSRRLRDQEYWRERVADLPERVTLAHSTVLPALSSDNIRSESELSGSLQSRLEELAGELNASAAVVLTAAFGAFLSRMSDTDGVVLNLPVTGRTTAKTRNAGGMLSNALPIHLRDAESSAVRDVIGSALLELTGALRHQRYRSEEILRDSGLSGGQMGFGPTINMVFFDAPLTMEGADLDYQILTSGALEDLLLNLYQAGPGEPISIDLHGNPGLYSQTEIDDHLRRFVVFLERFLADPDRSVNDLDLLVPGELEELEATAGKPDPRQQPLAGILEDAAAIDPDALAVISGPDSITYRDLDARSNQLARLLIEQGAGPETIVALAIPRSVALMVGMWAIAKSGAAYMPIDRDYPSDRIAYMLADSKTHLGLTIGGPPDAEAAAGIDWIRLDTDETARRIDQYAPAPVRDADRTGPLRPENLAYVIYTSGSTGRPKGVEVTHCGLHGFGQSLLGTRGAVDRCHVPGLTSPSFDASIAEYLLAFQSGGTLNYRPADAVAGRPLEEFIRASEIDTLILTPTVLSTLDPDRVPSVQSVMVGGEALSGRLRDVWAHSRSIHNAYGPTEATIALTHSHELESKVPVLLGIAVHGAKLYILDDELRQVPVGVLGELYAETPGLARGYHERPDKTAERFIANPFGPRGSRLYRTGDVVRWRAGYTGHLNLQYHGRSDDQIKLRGLRIELGEIGAAVRRVEGVTAAVVVGVDADGVPVPSGVSVVAGLAAYLVGDAEAIDLHDVRRALRSALPEYMVPARYAVLDELPSTPVGKLDRAALPVAEVIGGAGHYVAPESEIEHTLVALIEELLDVERIGTGDNIFELGADSLMAARLASRAREHAGLEVSLADVFGSATVGEMAKLARSVDASTPELQPYPRTGPIPVSYPQTRLWVINRIDPASGAYNIPGAVRLGTDTDEAALEAAVTDLLERHESLRTVFPANDDGTPHQHILSTGHAVSEGVFQVVDTTAADLDERLAQITAAGFDLVADLPARIRLIRVDADGPVPSYVLAVVLHHIVGDGLSMGPLILDLMTAYAARRDGGAPDHAPLPVQYADYTLWQRDRLGDIDDPGSILAEQIAFWTAELAGLPELLALPTDNPRPAVPSGTGAYVDRSLDADTVAALRRLAAEQHVTLFTVFQAVAAIMIGRLTGAGDLAIGTAVAGRDDARLHGMVGMFVNSVAVRHRLVDDMSAGDFLQRANHAVTRAISHSDVPFEQVVDAVGVSRSRDHSPVFQVELVMQHDEVKHLLAEASGIDIVDARVPAAKFDLGFSLVEHGATGESAGEIAISLNYATDLFASQTAERLLGYFCRIARRLATDSGALGLRISEIAEFTDAELNTVAALSRGPEVAVPSATLSDLLRRQIEAAPDAIALTFGRRDMTYREFGDRVARLAHTLIDAGVTTGTAVAVGIPRSFELFVAVHAVVAAGGQYVPIDLRQPGERIAYMCATAGVRVLLTAGGSTDALPSGLPDDAAVIVVDAATATIGTPTGVPAVTVRDHDAAYTLFTSGSTGRPKGVTVEHRAIVNRLAWMQADYPLGKGDSVLHKTPITFDVSVWELFWPLTAGARVVIAEPDRHGEPVYLHDLIVGESITMLHFVPSMLSAFVDVLGADRVAELDSLRVVFTSGEALTAPAANALLHALPAVELHNLYGPTEAAVDVTAERATIGERPVPIGSPVWNTETYVLDPKLRMLPLGVPGELYLGGVQLARGYASQAALTAERFVADPFGPSGARLYRTGDLVKWNSDGRLEYLGRTDFQVKLRGQRLELGEVEAALAAVPGVVHAAAGLAQFPTGDQLVGYLAPKSADVAAARAAVAASLPEYMRPTLWVTLPEMPLNAAGKVDRRALPDPTLPDVEYVAPTGQIEEMVAAVFAEVLGADSVGVAESFFELGGNSLSATKVIARLGAALDRNLPIAAIFDAPSVAELADYIRTTDDDFRRPALVSRELGDRGPLSTVQRGMWLINRADPDSPAYNIGFALQMQGDLSLPALRQAVHDVVARHESLRTVYPMVDGDPIQVVLGADEMVAGMDYREIDVLGEVETVIAEVAGQGFDVTAAPPVRMAVLKTGPQEFVTVTVIHHIAADGASTVPLARDLMAAYGARVDGGEPAWAPLPAQYLDFALWQEAWLASTERSASGEAQRQLDYWADRLAGAPAMLELPADHPRPRVPDYQGAVVEFEIPATLVHRLEVVARQHHATLFMITEAAFAVLLSRLSRQHDVVIGTPYGGRSDRSLDDVVGMFVNTLAMRTELRDEEKFAELLARVRADVMTDLDNADVAFDTVVSQVLDRIPTAYNPVYQAMFAFQNFYFPTVELSSLSISPVSEQVLPAKVDLQLTLYPNDPNEQAKAGAPMRGQMLFAAALFDHATVERYAERYVRILEQVAELPQIAVGDIAIDIAGDQPTQKAEAAEARSLSDLVAEASAVAPEAEAVSLSGTTVTFAALSATVSVMAAAIPDPDSALTATLMSVLPTLAAGGAEQLGQVLADLRERAESAANSAAQSSTEGMINS